MQKILLITILIAYIAINNAESSFRPPAVPLIVQDPYTSIWSAATNLTDSWTTHWTGQIQALVGMVNIDGTCYRFMGPQDMSGSVCTNALQQTNLVVNATSSYYTFSGAGIELNVQFMTPALLDDFDLLALPQSYIKYTIINTDSKSHAVKLYYDNSAEVVVSQQSELVEWNQTTDGNLTILKIGTSAQTFNGDYGSDRIDWGFWYVTAKQSSQYTLSTTVSSDVNARGAFAKNSALPTFDTNMPRACGDNWPVLAISFDFGEVSSNQQVTSLLSIAYDEVYSMDYFGTKFKRYWTRLFKDIPDLFTQTFANDSYIEDLFEKCAEFDNDIFNQLFSAENNNNLNYSMIGSLAYRQVTGGIIIVWNDVLNTTWAFMKEISSDGDVSTVDVIFPSSPLFFVKNPEIFRLILLPLLAYANNETQIYGAGINYNLSWAPHHLGHWPVCNIEPMQQEQMPIEETGNLIILITFIAQAQENIDYLKPYWPLLEQYGQYLIENLPDPGNQLCTDDFEGPSPHNANLAAKGIIAIAAYSKLLEMKNKGSNKDSEGYMAVAQNYSAYWQKFDFDDNHFELEYNDTNTWSQKYNILFDVILGTNVFPQSVITTELAYYISQLQTYGIPLDNRSLFTKLDWSFWSAAMGSNDQFQTITNAIFDFANATPNRVPLTDWYWTNNAQQAGFQARPVVGGVWAKVLIESATKQQQKLVQE